MNAVTGGRAATIHIHFISHLTLETHISSYDSSSARLVVLSSFVLLSRNLCSVIIRHIFRLYIFLDKKSCGHVNDVNNEVSLCLRDTVIFFFSSSKFSFCEKTSLADTRRKYGTHKEMETGGS